MSIFPKSFPTCNPLSNTLTIASKDIEAIASHCKYISTIEDDNGFPGKIRPTVIIRAHILKTDAYVHHQQVKKELWN